MNELLWLVMMLVNFAGIISLYYLMGKKGLYIWVGFAIVLANIQVLKTIELFGFTTTLGNVIYGTTFLATDIMSELYGYKEAKKAVWVGFYTMIFTTVIMGLCLLFVPSPYDIGQESLLTIFGFMPRIAAGSLLAYFLSNHFDVWAYHRIKRKYGKKHQIWIRNNGSTMISQAIDTVVVTSVMFIGVYEWPVWWSVLFATYIMKWVVAVADTPFVYLARRIYEKKEGKNEISKGVST